MGGIKEFLKHEASGGILLMIATVAALLCQNTFLSDFYNIHMIFYNFLHVIILIFYLNFYNFVAIFFIPPEFIFLFILIFII